ncbi:hypothetical protein ACS2BK_10010 [Enterococcus faecium]|uniref:hypothetical protein n=1 Tax=Enterococcus faecium TaxID=1352 RepID=UPI001A0C7107|nr:hypothetical protein [Enterococcus faecium]EMF0536206.1 hypothetical protein [Enterococcus hirae]
MKKRNIEEYLAHTIFILVTGFLSLLFSLLCVSLLLLGTSLLHNIQAEDTLTWFISMVFFYFIPAIFFTIYLLNKWNHNPKFIVPNLFSSNNIYIEFDKSKLSQVIEIITILVTFLLLINKSYTVNFFDTTSNSILLIIYPVNLGFKLWNYSLTQNKKVKQYFPHRKYK